MGESTVIDNRKARHDYFLFDRYECGIQLQGSEVKSIREGRMNLRDAYVRIMHGEVFIVNLHISNYAYAHIFVPEETRTRKLLLKKKEIDQLTAQMAQKGYACIPTKAYFKKSFVKIEIALAKKKKSWDKRQDLKDKIHDRETKAAIKRNLRK